MSHDPRRLWASLAAFVPAPALAEQARALEGAGLAGIFSPQIYGPPFVPLAACAAVTDRIALATGVAMAFTRSPFETAMAAMDLDRLSAGRFTLGLGTSVRSWSGGIFGMPYGRPISRLRETIELIRLVIGQSHRGGLDRFEGEYHRHDFSEFQPFIPPVRDRIPIWVGVLREPLTRFAAEVADGVIGHPIWSVGWATTRAQEAIARGLAASGRSRSDVHVNMWFFAFVNPSRREAIEDARPTVAFYAGVAQYEEYFAAHGFREEARRCQEGVQRGDYLGVAHAVPDEMVETFALCGPIDAIRRRLAPAWDAADSLCLVPHAHGRDPDVVAAYAGRLAEAFYG